MAIAENETVAEKSMNIKGHVLVAIPDMIVGGADTVTLRIAEHLKRQGHVFSVVTHVSREKDVAGDTSEEFSRITPEIYRLDKFIEPGSWKDFISYLIGTRKTKIVHIVGSDMMYPLMAGLKKKYPSLRFTMPIFNEYNLPYALKYYDQADAVICDNEAIAANIRQTRQQDSNKICVIANGVDVSYFSRAPEASASGSAGIAEGRFTVSYVGRLSEEKGPDRFVEIAEQFCGEQDMQFVLGGIGPMAGKCADMVRTKNLDRLVMMPGFVDVKKVLSSSDVVVVPSRLDGKPLIVMESMAMGVPVIASGTGGIPEMVIPGRTGFLCDKGNVSEFAQKIDLLRKDRALCREMSTNAREYAERYFDIGAALKSYAALFDKLSGS